MLTKRRIRVHKILTCLDPSCCCCRFESNPKRGVDTGEDEDDGDAEEDDGPSAGFRP